MTTRLATTVPRATARLAIAGCFALAACAGDDDDTAPAAPVTSAPAADTSSSGTSAPTTTPQPVSTATASTAGASTLPATTSAPPTAPTTAVPTTAPPTTAAAPDVPAPDALGPYGVGHTTLMLTDDARGRPLTVDVWYPVEAGSTGEPAAYSLLPELGIESEVALSGAPAAGERSFPLVIYSHGSGGLRYIASFYTEVLASHGFVVAAPDHAGNTALDRLAGTATSSAETATNRLGDVTYVIDEVVAANDPTTVPFAGAVDGEQIAVTGHSLGGFTALAGVSGYTVDGVTVAPEERIDAIVAMAPASQALSDEQLADVDVPTLLITGTDDATTPIDPNVTRVWDLAPGRPLYRVDLADAGHQSFTDVCRYQEALPTLPDVPEIVTETVDEFAVDGCSPDQMADERAHDITNTYAVAFLQTVLAGEDGYGSYLTTDAAASSGDLSFQVQS